MNEEPKENALAISNPQVLVASAIERGLDPDRLGKLIDMAENWAKNRAIEAFNVAMNACQAEMPIVIRDATNQQTSSKYARLETVDIAIRPIYTRHGFSVGYGEDEPKREKCIRLWMDVAHNAGHCKRIWGDFPLDDVGPKGTVNKTGIQATGSSYSYAKRYLLCMGFNVTIANDDNDGQAQVARISPDMFDTINQLAQKCSDAGDPIDRDRLLKWRNIDQLIQMPLKDYELVVDFLQRKIKNAKKGAQPSNTST